MKGPTVSVVVPVYNEEQNLPVLHSALKAQDFSDYEILYIDDASTDGSWNVLEGLSREDNVRSFRLDKNYPVGYVRAFGVERAQGKYVASIDADCEPTPNWLSMVKHLEGQTAVVGFPVIPPPGLDYLARKLDYTGDGKPNPKLFLHGSGVLMKRDVVLAVGNYPPRRIGEDTHLFIRISNAGRELKLSQEARIYHRHKQLAFIDFLRRFYRTGRNNTGAKSFVIFGLGFPALLLLSLWFVYSIGTPGLVSLILPIGFLINPIRVLSYMRDFAKPENRLAKLALFSGIRILISISFISGLWKGAIYLAFKGRRLCC